MIAVDREFVLFKRAWCVAEIAEARKSNTHAFLKVASSKSIDDHYESTIEHLDLRECTAYREQDKKDILRKIEKHTNIERFNLIKYCLHDIKSLLTSI